MQYNNDHRPSLIKSRALKMFLLTISMRVEGIGARPLAAKCPKSWLTALYIDLPEACLEDPPGAYFPDQEFALPCNFLIAPCLKLEYTSIANTESISSAKAIVSSWYALKSWFLDPVCVAYTFICFFKSDFELYSSSFKNLFRSSASAVIRHCVPSSPTGHRISNADFE